MFIYIYIYYLRPLFKPLVLNIVLWRQSAKTVCVTIVFAYFPEWALWDSILWDPD